MTKKILKIGFCVGLTLGLAACEDSSSGGSGSGSQPKPDTQALTAEVLKLDGQKLERVVLALSGQLEKHQLTHRLDQVVEILDENFTLHCEETCHIQQKNKEN